jgi:hypothetical protein
MIGCGFNREQVESIHSQNIIYEGERYWVYAKHYHRLDIPKEDNQDYEYFLSLVNLFAEMCMNRNYFCIKILENIYKSDLLFSLVKNDDLDFPLRSKALNLLLHLHINR